MARFRLHTDHELILAAQAGEPGALDALLRRFGPRIFRICRRMSRDLDELEEVYQDTLYELGRNLGNFRGEAALMTWAYTIARTQWNRRVRRKGEVWRRSHLEVDLNRIAHRVVDPVPLPESACASVQLRGALEAALGQLSELDRRVLVLRDFEGMTAPEVAGETGLTVPAVKTRLHRARTAMRQRLQGEWGEASRARGGA